MQVARLLQEDYLPALVELKMVCEDINDDGEACAGAAALFECLGRGVCPKLKHLSIRKPSYAFLPLLADALVLRGEVVKGSLESFALSDAQWSTRKEISSEELRAALAKLVQATCLSQLQKLELKRVAQGSWAAAIYLNSTASTEHIKELRIAIPARMFNAHDEYVHDAEGVEAIVTALAAGMYTRCSPVYSVVPDFFPHSVVCMTGRAPRLKTLYCDQISYGEMTLDKLCNAISQGVLKHLEELSLTEFLTEEATTQLTTAVAIGCPGLKLLSYPKAIWAPGCRNKVVAAALRASQHPLLFYKSIELYEDAGLRDIVAALQQTPQGLSAVTSLQAGATRAQEEEGQEMVAHEEVLTLLGRVMDRCPALQEVRVYGENVRALVTAMAPGGALAGGTRGIHRLCCFLKDTDACADTTLRALAAGACPQLREADFKVSAPTSSSSSSKTYRLPSPFYGINESE
jgi:hypothetical protein